ncbi:hypothetical protein CK203_082426 [Vitis vinifera]|uniref:Uncharacterized protein n=1 Tax=Vitis vinifera TaxID=29760 RepID=A0A438BNE4_VITVI|nr:hypothetical protein CK203_082426 [Vitis vinifera]
METSDCKEIWGGKWWLVLRRFKESHGVGLWKMIRKWWLEFNERVAFKVGMVEECVFGRIDGVEKILWMRLFPRLYYLPPPRMLRVAQLWISPGIWLLETLFSQDSTMMRDGRGGNFFQ